MGGTNVGRVEVVVKREAAVKSERLVLRMNMKYNLNKHVCNPVDFSPCMACTIGMAWHDAPVKKGHRLARRHRLEVRELLLSL